MRPLLSDDNLAGRSRSPDDITRAQPPSMTYFIADEKTMEASLQSQNALFPKSVNSLKLANYGVESCDVMVNSLNRNIHDSDERSDSIKHAQRKLPEKSTSYSDDENIEEGLLSSNLFPELSRNTSPSRPLNVISRPFTPLSSQSPAPASSPSSPDSRMISEIGYYTDDVISQDVISNKGEEQILGTNEINSESTPQLIMPSIKMPSRRPFTEKGRVMGRLKVLIAGDSGIGKTSLVKAIVQVCEDIVHVDPIRAPSLNLRKGNRSSHRTKSKTPETESTLKITEIFASTRPYPVWWSDLEESRLIRRKKGLEDTVLERNLCFVDTPGYGNKNSQLERISCVVDYIESQFKKLSTFEGPSESEMINLLSGNGGSQVDVVFYLISNGLKTIDIEYMRRLSELTNIIPLIAQADKNSEKQISLMKEHLISELHSVNIKPFLFELNSNNLPKLNNTQTSAPFAISCKTSRDLETMDASLLMSPDYVQPLIDSELKSLISQIFERDSISWLRHAAAKKFILWRSSSNLSTIPQPLYQPLTKINSSRILTAPVGATTSYALARITDHTQREERIAQVRLANWAAELQRSLQNERSRFEKIARSERAVWLTERLGECVQDGSIVPLSQARREKKFNETNLSTFTKSKFYSQYSIKNEEINANDPLGLLNFNHKLKRKGWILVKTVSSLGIASGLAYLAARTWHENWQICGSEFMDWIGLRVLNC
ncbi:Septin [Erysiphe necator]|uniref:Putative heat shock protein n=1 Tax=Uncinula necator TaxID=52586 RepID=A0A0B1PAW4_UNCNE|nr:Septin [Erysiphe necator]KHJ35802.1 putative heat shock protein [Erysiphe necator]